MSKIGVLVRFVAIIGFLIAHIATSAQNGAEPPSDALFSAFAKWHSDWTRGSSEVRKRSESDGLALARRRSGSMKQLIREHPEHALEVAISSSARSELPEGIRDLIEEEVSGYATIGHYFECDHAVAATVIRLDGKLYLSHADAPAISLGRRVPVRGVSLGSEIALAKSPLKLADATRLQTGGTTWPAGTVCAGCGKGIAGAPRSFGAEFANQFLPLCRADHLSQLRLTGAYAGLEGGSSGTSPGPPASWTLGGKRLLYIPTLYSDQGSPPTTRTAAESSLAQVAQYYATQSYQQTALTSVVTDPITAPQPASYYSGAGLVQLYNDVTALARTAGWDPDEFDFVFIRHSGGPGGPGVGLVGQKGAWVQTDSWSVLAHELGHNYGLFHANAWRARTSFPSGPGEIVEYADAFDMMGPNRGSFNAYEKSVLHWMPDWAVPRITNSGVYRIQAFDTASIVSNQVYALTVRKDVRDYWLDFRGEFKNGTLAPYALNGLQIHWPQWSQSRGGSTLVDSTSGTPQDFNDAPLAIGRTFSDSQAGVHITTLNRSTVPGQWLDVSIVFDDGSNNSSPAATLSTSSTNVSPGEAVTFAVHGTDPEGDPLSYGWEMSASGNAAVLTVSSNSPNLSYAWSTTGRYEVRCTVSDMRGGIAFVSTVVNVGASSDYAISGIVTNADGAPRQNVRVYSLSSSVSVSSPTYVTHSTYRSGMTDSSGRYVVLNVPGGSQTVRVLPTVSETFSPATGTGVFDLSSDVGGGAFVATTKPGANVRGYVRDGGRPVTNAVLRIAGLSTSSASDGSFLFSNVPAGSHGVEVVGRPDFIAPGSPVYADGIDVTNVAVERVLYPVKGRVPGTLGLAYVGNGEPERTVLAFPSFTGGLFGDLEYELHLPRGTWNLEATASGYIMTPNGFTNPITISGVESPFYSEGGIQPPAYTNLNFSAVFGTAFSIRGTVTSAAGPLEHVSVSAGGTVAQTDSIGNYFINGLPAGSYTVSASLPGYAFTTSGFANPVSVGPDATDIDFTGIDTNPSSPIITSHPQGKVVTVTSNVTFSATATGTPPLTYQWFFNGTTPIPGATNTSITITNVKDANGGQYSVVVSNGSSATSSNALLTVNHPPSATTPVLERFAFNGTKARIADFIGSDLDGDSVTLFSVGPTSAHGGSVTTNAGWVVYTPAPGFTNVDSFPFALTDGRGGLTHGTATVSVTYDNVTPQNFRADILGDGSVRLTFDGIPSRTYSIEFTENLQNASWQTLGTVTANALGIFTFTNSLPAGAPQRFYRAAWP